MRRDFGWIVLAYAVALLAALGAVYAFGSYSPLWRAAAADLAATLVVFGFSRMWRNSSFYDAYWSVAPPLLMAYWWWSAPGMALGLREVLLGGLVLAWAVRLTHNWARGWQGLSHVDWRYLDLAQKTGGWFVWVDFFGVHLMPTLLVFVACLPLWLIGAESGAALHPLDGLWVICGYGAVMLERRADNVLYAFRSDPANRGKVLREDVWRWCRHPNYLGELGFWFALALCGWTASGEWLAWCGFAAMLALFLGYSIPALDKRQLQGKPAYADYVREVPALIPGTKRRKR